MSKLPVAVTETLLHVKDTDRTEKVILPITRYKSVLNAPKVITDAKDVNGSPFTLLACETEELDTAALRKLIPNIV